jgi:tRNA 2-selenouridine synthase
MDAMRTRGHCLNLVLGDAERVALLMEDYDFFVRDTEAFCARLAALTEIRGKAVVQAWQADVRAGRLRAVVQDLLTGHYDPVYLQSMQRNFRNFARARTLVPADRSVAAMDAVAATLVHTQVVSPPDDTAAADRDQAAPGAPGAPSPGAGVGST